MAWNEWAYDTAQTNPAGVESTNWEDIDAFIDGSRNRNTYVNGLSPDLNALFVYPVMRTGSPLDEWYERNESLDVFAYIADPADASGLLYEITEGFSEMDYPTAKQKARNDLEVYLRTYQSSQFTAAGFTFSAGPVQVVDYLVIDTRVSKSTEPHDEVVFDIDDDAHRFTLTAEWDAFWQKYENLFADARNITDAAWTDIKNATTTDEVRIIMAALPPIPGTV